MEQDVEYRRQKAEYYERELQPLFKYLPWLESKKGASVSSGYTGNDAAAGSMVFPVYDGTLLSFVKDAQRTGLIDRNYVYVYSRCHMQGPEDELREIENVSLKETDVLTAILSKYICEGMTKGRVWPLAVEKGIFLAVLLKFKELFTYLGRQE